MRAWITFALMGALALPAYGVQQVTVEQLQQMMTQEHAAHKSDKSEAKLLASLELTERLTEPTLERIKRECKLGSKTANALELLADTSGVLDPPAAELPDKPRPTLAEQQMILTATVGFVVVRLKHLPDFLATRTTYYYNDESLQLMTASGPFTYERPLHLAKAFKQEITYRGRREVLNDLHVLMTDSPERQFFAPRMTTSGDFGSELGTVLTDAAKGQVAWSHWENTSTGLAATFKYWIPTEASHYAVYFCCVQEALPPDGRLPDGNANSYQGMPGYHGSFTVDPATGAILRLTIVSDLQSSGPLEHYALWVRYGHVKIGESIYICPIRSSVQTVTRNERWAYGRDSLVQINDVSYSDYHHFSTAMKIVGLPPAQ